MEGGGERMVLRYKGHIFYQSETNCSGCSIRRIQGRLQPATLASESICGILCKQCHEQDISQLKISDSLKPQFFHLKNENDNSIIIK